MAGKAAAGLSGPSSDVKQLRVTQPASSGAEEVAAKQAVHGDESQVTRSACYPILRV